MTIALSLAILMSIVTFLVHTFIGGIYVARPLLADKNLPVASKWLNYYCWHVTSIMIVFLGIGFWLCQQDQENSVMIGFLAALSTASAILSAAVALKGRINPLRFPSTSLFSGIALCGWAALWQAM